MFARFVGYEPTIGLQIKDIGLQEALRDNHMNRTICPVHLELAIFFSSNKSAPATGQPVVLFSPNQSAPASQLYFSLITNRHQPPNSQLYFSLIINQHHPPTSYTFLSKQISTSHPDKNIAKTVFGLLCSYKISDQIEPLKLLG